MTAYLDNSATTRPCAQATEAMHTALTQTWGNPSSQHALGLAAETLVCDSRAAVAKQLFCLPEEIIFTSGGTEANNLALFGAANAQKRRGKRIVTTAVEHSSIAESAAELARRGFELIYLGVDKAGRIREDELLRAVNRDTILISIMAVNNETGTIQPVDSVRRIARGAGAPALIHCDCVQAFGKLPCRPQKLNADLITVSAHKVHGPKGAGALYVRKGVRLVPILFGGSQEGKRRPGTEGVPAIAGFAAACEAMGDLTASLHYAQALNDRLRNGVLAMPGIKINSPEDALPYLLNISLPGYMSETLLNFLSARGVCVSSGSACAKGKKSRVLSAMGLPEADIAGALRISLSRHTTVDEIDYFLATLNEARLSLARR